jgi:hypothetical protein
MMPNAPVNDEKQKTISAQRPPMERRKQDGVLGKEIGLGYKR